MSFYDKYSKNSQCQQILNELCGGYFLKFVDYGSGFQRVCSVEVGTLYGGNDVPTTFTAIHSYGLQAFYRLRKAGYIKHYRGGSDNGDIYGLGED
jgi:hypothetical protein